MGGGGDVVGRHHGVGAITLRANRVTKAKGGAKGIRENPILLIHFLFTEISGSCKSRMAHLRRRRP